MSSSAYLFEPNANPAHQGTAASPAANSGPGAAHELVTIGFPDLSGVIKAVLVGGSTQAVATIKRIAQSRQPPLQIVHAAHSPQAESLLASGDHHVAIVVDDLVGRSVLRTLQDGEILVPAVCVAESVEASKRSAVRQRLRLEGAAATLFMDALDDASLDVALGHTFDVWRLATALADARARAPANVMARLIEAEDFEARVQAGVARHHAEPTRRCAVLNVHVSRFSRLDEIVGSGPAEAMRAAFEERVCQAAGARGLVTQYGPDSFLVLLVGDDAQDPDAVARVRDTTHRAFLLGDDQVYLEVQIGLARTTRRDADGAALIKRAQEATSGGFRPSAQPWELSQPQMRRDEALAAVQLEGLLQDALKRQEFSLVYQPIVDLNKGKLRGFEALIRWRDQQGADHAPSEFIPAAERSQLIIPIGYWALEHAVRQMTEWDRDFELDGAVSMSVNLSARQAADPRLVERIRSLLMTTGLPGGALRLEIAETAVAEHHEAVAELVNRLTETGVRVWLEGVGEAGYTWKELQHLPLEGLKLDRAHVEKLDGTEAGAAGARKVVEIAKKLRIETVAVGIENQLQANYLRWLGCSVGQGYLYSRPLALGDAFGYLANHGE